MLRSLCHVTYAERTAEAAAAAVAAVAGAGEVVQYPSARPAPPPAAVRQPAAACTRRTPPLSPEQPNAYSYSSFFSPAHSIDRSVQGTAECAFDQLISQTRFPTCHSDSAGLISDQAESIYAHHGCACAAAAMPAMRLCDAAAGWLRLLAPGPLASGPGWLLLPLQLPLPLHLAAAASGDGVIIAAHRRRRAKRRRQRCTPA
jgi:hypothetical protein